MHHSSLGMVQHLPQVSLVSLPRAAARMPRVLATASEPIAALFTLIVSHGGKTKRGNPVVEVFIALSRRPPIHHVVLPCVALTHGFLHKMPQAKSVRSQATQHTNDTATVTVGFDSSLFVSEWLRSDASTLP